MIGPCSQEGVPATVSAFDAQPAASGNIPSRAVARGDDSVNQCFSNEQQVMNIITLRVFQNLDPSTDEGINGFVKHIENIRRAFIVDFDKGSLVLTVKCNSLEILKGLWEDYSTGRLGELAQQFLVTEEILEELGLAEVKIKTTILEEDYRACQKYLIKISGMICFSPVLKSLYVQKVFTQFGCSKKLMKKPTPGPYLGFSV